MSEPETLTVAVLDDDGLAQWIEDSAPSRWWRDWPDLDNLPEPVPLVATEQGQTLIPAEGLTTLYGPMASGKSWCALGIATVVAIEGRCVLIDGEMGLVPTARRLRPLCGTPPAGLRYAGMASTVEIIEWLTGADKRLLVIDTIGSIGGHSDSAAEYIEWHNANIAPFLNADIPVLAVDHDIRSKAGHKDRLQHGAIGSAAKGNMADLVYQVIGANWSGTTGGKASIVLRKDRYGVHASPVNAIVAELVIDYDTAGGMDYRFENAAGIDPTPAGQPSSRVTDRIRRDILSTLSAAFDGLTLRVLRASVQGKSTAIDSVAEQLIETGEVVYSDNVYRLTEMS